MLTRRIKCPSCGGTMTAGRDMCPHFGCYVNIYDEIEFLRTVVVSKTISIEDKNTAQKKLNELEEIYCKE